jgi:hypothetical protein
MRNLCLSYTRRAYRISFEKKSRTCSTLLFLKIIRERGPYSYLEYSILYNVDVKWRFLPKTWIGDMSGLTVFAITSTKTNFGYLNYFAISFSEAVNVASYLAQFFMREVRRSAHKFPSRYQP